MKRAELVALAFVCPTCRYAALLRPGRDWIEHRAASHRTWREINRELTGGFAPVPIPQEAEIYKLLALGTGADLRWTESGPVNAVHTPLFTSELETALRQSVTVPA